MKNLPLTRWATIFALLLAFGFVPAVAAENTPDLAGQVHAIFEESCTDCHGAHLLHPKGKFGYVLDLARVAANPKMVMPGNPDRSRLYQLILHDKMPDPHGEDGPLTPSQKEIVRQWIQAGAPTDTGKSGAETEVKPLSGKRRILRAFGQFHPLTTHFPIALLFCTLPAELLWIVTRRPEWKTVVRYCLTLGALSAVVSASLGWCYAVFDTDTSLLQWHRWVGTATAIWAVVAWAIGERARHANHTGRVELVFRVALVLGAILVGAAGFLGGSLAYGLDHFKF